MLSLTDFINAVEENDLEVDAVMAIRNDTILGLHRFSDDIYHNVFSVAKRYLYVILIDLVFVLYD